MPAITFALEAELSPTRLDELTRQLMRDLSRIGIAASLTERPSDPGERGVLTSIGNFVVNTLSSSKVAEAALGIIKAYFAREKSLHLSLTKADGTKIEIDAKNVSSATVADFLHSAKSILE